MPASPTTEFAALSAVCTQLRTIRPAICRRRRRRGRGRPERRPAPAAPPSSSSSSSSPSLPPSLFPPLLFVERATETKLCWGWGASSAAGFDGVEWGSGETKEALSGGVVRCRGGRGEGREEKKAAAARFVDESRTSQCAVRSVRACGRGRGRGRGGLYGSLRRHVPRRMGLLGGSC
jgi:hypothetical protein